MFLKLTRLDGTRVFVNMDNVAMIGKPLPSDLDRDGTMLTLGFGGHQLVKETVERIASLGGL